MVTVECDLKCSVVVCGAPVFLHDSLPRDFLKHDASLYCLPIFLKTRRRNLLNYLYSKIC